MWPEYPYAKKFKKSLRNDFQAFKILELYEVPQSLYFIEMTGVS